jgi:GAG-pre-integrase domain
LSGSPSDNNGPTSHGCRTTAEDRDLTVLSSPQGPTAALDLTDTISDPTLGDSEDTPPPMIPRESRTAMRSDEGKAAIEAESLVEDDDDKESGSSSPCYLVRSLSRQALRMLWHQRLGHLNFRRLSTMHRFVKGMPEFTLPNALEECPICLAAKLRKQPSGNSTIMHSEVCNQGISIDFGFMVQKSRDKQRHHNLIGINGETCYALITDHFSGRL